MAKTTSLEIECGNATIKGEPYQRILVTIEDPADIEAVIGQIHEGDLDQWIAQNRNPEDIFSTSDLEKWAESNGYTKE